MTKRREPLTPHRALSVIGGEMGWDKAGEICGGVGERCVRNWSDPDTPQNISLEDAVKLDAAWLALGKDHAPFATWYNAQLNMLAAQVDPGAIDRLQNAARLTKEAGEAATAQILAAQPGASPAIIAQAERETRELISEATRTLTGFQPQRLPAADPS